MVTHHSRVSLSRDGVSSKVIHTLTQTPPRLHQRLSCRKQAISRQQSPPVSGLPLLTASFQSPIHTGDKGAPRRTGDVVADVRILLSSKPVTFIDD